MFKGIVGVLKPLSGQIELGGLQPRDIAYLPQAAEIDRTFPISVYDMVAMGLWHRTGLFGGIDRAGRHEIEHAIAGVGLNGFEGRRSRRSLAGRPSACCSRAFCCRTPA